MCVYMCVYKEKVWKEMDLIVNCVIIGEIGIGVEGWRGRWRCLEFMSKCIMFYNRNEK